MDQHAINKQHSANSLRTQYQKINYLTIFLAAPLTGLSAYFFYSTNSTLSTAFLAGLSSLCAFVLARVLIMHFAVGTSLIPKGPFIEEVAERSDQKILEDEFVRVGGIGARKAAARLPEDIGNLRLTFKADQTAVIARLKEFFMNTGVLLITDPESSSYTVKGIIGCGVKQMNPTLVTIRLKSDQNQIEVDIYAVAKEGLRKQRSGKEAADILTKLLKDEFEESAKR